jgi:hypothetical protein
VDRATSLWLAVMGFALVGAGALYFCVPAIENDLHQRAADALGVAAAPSGWAVIDVEGQRVLISGVAPDVAARRLAHARLQALWGVTEVIDLTTFEKPSPAKGEALDSARIQLRSPVQGQPHRFVHGTSDAAEAHT